MLPTTRDPIHIASPDIDEAEEAAVLRVLRSGRLAQGPEVAAFEEEFAAASGVAHAVAVNNGTSAIIAALHAAGVGPGDEVLVPAFTFAATANSVLALGGAPVFVDIDDAYLMDLDAAAAAITDRTKVVMPVHLYGLMADMTAFNALAAKHGIAVVEDAAQAHLATRGGYGAGATIGAFSLYATKNMMTGEGGIVTTNDEAVADKVRLFRNHGMPQRYRHTEWGLNLRLTDLQGAIGRAQLVKLPTATARRIENAALLDAALPAGLRRPPRFDDAHHVFHQYTVAVPADHRDRLVAAFREAGVGVEVYYPEPIHHQPAFTDYADPNSCPRATEAARTVMSFPVHPAVSADDIDYIGEVAQVLFAETP